MLRAGQTVMLSPEDLRGLGIDIELIGITARKGRPYVIVARNGHMTWMMPLTTQLKGKHGRVQIEHTMRGRTLTCEAITSDIVSVHTPRLEDKTYGTGFVDTMNGIVQQMISSLSSGRIGA